MYVRVCACEYVCMLVCVCEDIYSTRVTTTLSFFFNTFRFGHPPTHTLTPSRRDDQAVVFIEVTNTASNMTQRAPFFPQVDEFSVLEIPDSGSLFYRNESITVSVVMGNNAYATPPRAYTDGSSFVGYYSALIHMRNGRVLRIEWDEGCSGCPDGCVANNCALPYASYGSPCLDPECAIKVYVAWLGTDKDDQVLTSPSLLPSNFRRFALSPVVKDASAVSGNTVDRAQENPPAA